MFMTKTKTLLPLLSAAVLDERKMALEVLSGKRKGQVNEGNPQLNRFVYDYGVYIRYKDPDALK